MVILQDPELVQLVSSIFRVGIARQMFLRSFSAIIDEGFWIGSAFLCTEVDRRQAGTRQKKRGLQKMPSVHEMMETVVQKSLCVVYHITGVKESVRHSVGAQGVR